MAALPSHTAALAEKSSGIPLPIVRLNRVIMVTGVIAAIALQAPLFTTALFLLVLPAALLGRHGSPLYQIGRRLLARHINRPGVETEDANLMRFNNSIAAILLGLAQIAFLAGAPLLGYAFTAMVGVAAVVALLGFCLGCFLYFQFKLNKRRLFPTES
jgi:hypothetical protein